MRLTSYNIASKILLAKCCMSDLAIKMIEAKALGNQELIHCTREKITALDAMIFALGKWYPVIPNAKLITAVFTIDSGVYVTPFNVGPTYIGGIQINNGFSVFSGGNVKVNAGFAHSINEYVSPNDDRIQVSAEYTATTTTLSIVYGPEITNFSIAALAPSSSPSISAVVSSPVDYTEKASCLSDKRVENILRKIDEICSCGCGEEVISDSMSKYMNLEV